MLLSKVNKRQWKGRPAPGNYPTPLYPLKIFCFKESIHGVGTRTKLEKCVHNSRKVGYYFPGVDYALCSCPISLYAYFEAADLHREYSEGSSGNLAKG
jgi:hypothetical protein